MPWAGLAAQQEGTTSCKPRGRMSSFTQVERSTWKCGLGAEIHFTSSVADRTNTSPLHGRPCPKEGVACKCRETLLVCWWIPGGYPLKKPLDCEGLRG